MRVLEKLIAAQIVNKSPAYHGIRIFITVLQQPITGAR